MKLTHFGDNSVQLTRWPLLFPVNVYLVRETDGFTLIDAGVGGSAPTIARFASQLGAPIVRIALTHAHGDHVGSLDALHQLLPDVEVLMSGRTARFLSGDLTLEPSELGTKLRGSFKTATTLASRTISPGDRIGSLDVIAAPGHSPDQIAFLDSRDRALIAGDAFQTRAGVAVSGTVKPLFPFPAMATWDRRVALKTARELTALSPNYLAVGHGRVLDNPAPQMDVAIAQAERSLSGEAQRAH